MERKQADGNTRRGDYTVPKQQGADAYSGRFGSSVQAGSRRPTGSYRTAPSGSYRTRMDYGEVRSDAVRRPSIRDGGDSYTRRPEKKTKAKRPVKGRSKVGGKADAKRRDAARRRRSGLGGTLATIIALAAVVALLFILFGGSGKPVHQLPTVERLGAMAAEAGIV